MILEQENLVAAPAAEIFQFFEDMEQNYAHWHPDHHHFEWRKGRGCKVGNVFYIDETIAGQRQPKQVVFIGGTDCRLVTDQREEGDRSLRC